MLLYRSDHRHGEAHLDIGRRHYEVDVELPHLRRPHLFRRDEQVEVEVDGPRRRQYDTELDVTERQYRSKFQPSYREEVRVNETTVDPPRFQPTYREEVRVNESTVDPPRPFRPSYKEGIRISEETVDPPRFKQDKMGYYDEDGKSFSVRAHTTIPS